MMRGRGCVGVRGWREGRGRYDGSGMDVLVVVVIDDGRGRLRELVGVAVRPEEACQREDEQRNGDTRRGDGGHDGGCALGRVADKQPHAASGLDMVVQCPETPNKESFLVRSCKEWALVARGNGSQREAQWPAPRVAPPSVQIPLGGQAWSA